MKVIIREEEWLKRKVKEAVYIRQKRPTMNRDLGYQLLPLICDLIIPEQHDVTCKQQTERDQDL